MSRRAPSVAALRVLRACIDNPVPRKACLPSGPWVHDATPIARLYSCQVSPGAASAAICLQGQQLQTRSQQPSLSSCLEHIEKVHRPSGSRATPLYARLAHLRGRRRDFSHLATATSVNATTRIPAVFQELHSALKSLEDVAINYVNLTQLSLALRGLESEDPTIRVAVLTFDSLDSAIRLAKSLLADPLEDEQLWEVELKESSTGTAVLLRYGSELGVDTTNPLLRVIQVPSGFLQKHRLELLLHQTNAVPGSGAAMDAASKMETLLDLNLGSTSGRSARMLYPVHKSIVLASGFSGIQKVLASWDDSFVEQGNLVSGVVNVPWQDAAVEPGVPGIALVNVSEADAAIAAFRQSLDNAFKYEHGWLNSNAASVLDTLAQGTIAGDSVLKPVLQKYIELVLRGIEAAVEQEEVERQLSDESFALAPATRDRLLAELRAWAEFGHTELRDELDEALQSRTWRKIAWWKLAWRVDDIGLVMSDLLQRSYLVNAERYLQWLGGTFYSTGLQLAEEDEARGVDPSINKGTAPAPQGTFGQFPSDEEVVRMVQQDLAEARRAAAAAGQAPASSGAATTLNATDDAAVAVAPLPRGAPWPQQIARSRNALLESIAPLHARAQAIVVRAASTAGLASAVGALAYVGAAASSGYTAGAIAAFGAAWALGGAQKEWTAARDAWVARVREEGKRALEACEARGRALVEMQARAGDGVLQGEGGSSRGDETTLHAEGAGERERALQGVALVRAALEDIPKGKKE